MNMTWRIHDIISLLAIGLLLPMLQVPHCNAIRWLSIANGQDRYWNKTKDCSKARKEGGFIKQQVLICKRNLELMPVVAHSTRETLRVCQQLFAERRWNCSSVQMAPSYLADLTGGGREQAYVYALSTASLTQAIAKACSVGATTKCSCGNLPNEPPSGNFKWGGCSDDVRFGLTFSSLFGDSPFTKRKRTSKRSLMNLHNNAAGRKVVSDSITTDCKCHGVSGSCTIKTCWKALPDMVTIGATLQKRYAVAREVTNKKVKKSRMGKRDKSGTKEDKKEKPKEIVRRLAPVRHTKRSIQEDELVYFSQSSDYCLPDKSLGSTGTTGRECSKSNVGSGGCGSMCCGRGYTSEVVQIKERCECKYYWCCYVKCKICTKQIEINRCR